jgi:NADH-quinone oxidoreductase subunit N
MTNLVGISCELFYFCSAMVMLILSMLENPSQRYLYRVAWGLSFAGVLLSLASVNLNGLFFAQTYRVDFFSQVFKVALALGHLGVVSLCNDLSGVRQRLQGEFYMLLFICTLAMMMLTGAVHLWVIYLVLELSSYCLYILVALRRQKTIGHRAALQYFLVGICASALMVFGLALFYSATGMVFLNDLARLSVLQLKAPLVAVGVVLMLSGFFFKLALFPFHFWAPDAYQGASDQVATYIATASKVAAIAILIRVAGAIVFAGNYLTPVLIVLALFSMTIGNLCALVQKDLKRLLAYSSIAHAGYILLGLLCLGSEAIAAVIFYAGAVLIMKFTCFFVVSQVAVDGGNVHIDQLAGLHRRSPILALCLMMAVFALAGIPPTVGFAGKLLIFNAAISKGYLFLVIVAMVNVVVSLYYYLLLVKAAYLTTPEEETKPLVLLFRFKVLAVGLVIVMVVAGIYPAPLIQIARTATQAIF